MSGELLAVVISLGSEAPLPFSAGRASQAWFLEQIRRDNPALAARLHSAGSGRRPYSLSITRFDDAIRSAQPFSDQLSAQSEPQSRPVSQADRADSSYMHDNLHYRNKHQFRLTSVDPELSRFMTQELLPRAHSGDLEALDLGGIQAHPSGAMTSNHPWGGQTTFSQLAEDHLATLADQTAAAGSQITWQFGTPTAFHRNGMTIPLPLPDLVFGSLIRVWESFSPVPLPVSLGDYIARHVALARHHIGTRTVTLGRSERHVGFTGSATYQIVNRANSELATHEFNLRVQLLHMLAGFAFYTGVGIRTTVGMGQVRAEFPDPRA